MGDIMSEETLLMGIVNPIIVKITLYNYCK